MTFLFYISDYHLNSFKFVFIIGLFHIPILFYMCYYLEMTILPFKWEPITDKKHFQYPLERIL